MAIEEVEEKSRRQVSMPELGGPSTFKPQTAEARPTLVSAASLVPVLKGIALVLSVRALLLMALTGAFWLARMAMLAQSDASLYVLIAYCVLCVLPMGWLEAQRGQR